MKRYTVIIEEAAGNFAAYAPDVPGCIATGATQNEVVERMAEALELHLEMLSAMGQQIPEACTQAAVVSVAS